MTSTQRHELYLALMTPEALAEDVPVLAQMAVETVEMLEPLIDKWLRQAELDGCLKVLVEQAYHQQVPIMKLKEKIEAQIRT